MSEKKYCPLKFDLPQRRATREADWACDKACAWWDDFTGHCAILSISRHGGEGSFYRRRQEQKESIDRGKGGS